jgi:hypothetical protein
MRDVIAGRYQVIVELGVLKMLHAVAQFELSSLARRALDRA